MKTIFLLSIVSTLCALGAEIQWVPVGDPGNSPDANGVGAVSYKYRIGKCEITVEEYVEFLNAVASTDPHALWNPKMGLVEYRITEPVFAGRVPPRLPGCIRRLGEQGSYRYECAEGWEKKPVVYVSFLDAMRFANWVHNGKGAGGTESGAYEIAKNGGLAVHERAARVWVATEDEWVKAAYYQPSQKGGPEGGYWLYPTRSNVMPRLGEPGATGENLANFFNLRLPRSQFADYTRIQPVGTFSHSASYYGTLDQGGNVSEWSEALVYGTQRRIRGGSVGDTFELMQRVTRISSGPEKEYPDTGFRLACPAESSANGHSVSSQTSTNR